MSDDKVYQGAIKFGETTDSYDADGDLVSSLPVPPLTLDELNAGRGRIRRAIRCRRRRWSPRSSKAAFRSTNWRARESKWSASRG